MEEVLFKTLKIMSSLKLLLPNIHTKNLQQTATELGEMFRWTVLTTSNSCRATPYNS